jgi:hypothetical protein
VNEAEVPMGGPEEPLDARLQFFLEHQELIRDWAALATEVQDAAEGLLRELRVDVIADPRVEQLAIRVGSRVNGEEATGPVLYRATWCADDEGVPDVGIGLAWDGKVDPARVWPKAYMPYVGILCSHQTDAGRTLETRLRANTLSRLNDEPKFQKGFHWVAYRYVAPKPDWWRDIPAWRQGLVDELMAAWTRWSGLVDRAVAVER